MHLHIVNLSLGQKALQPILAIRPRPRQDVPRRTGEPIAGRDVVRGNRNPGDCAPALAHNDLAPEAKFTRRRWRQAQKKLIWGIVLDRHLERQRAIRAIDQPLLYWHLLTDAAAQSSSDNRNGACNQARAHTMGGVGEPKR